MITHKKYIKALEVVDAYRKQQSLGTEIRIIDKDAPAKDIDMSVRLWNVLAWYLEVRYNKNVPLSKIEGLSKKEFLRWRNAGRRTLQELERICEAAKINLSE